MNYLPRATVNTAMRNKIAIILQEHVGWDQAGFGLTDLVASTCSENGCEDKQVEDISFNWQENP